MSIAVNDGYADIVVVFVLLAVKPKNKRIEGVTY